MVVGACEWTFCGGGGAGGSMACASAGPEASTAFSTLADSARYSSDNAGTAGCELVLELEAIKAPKSRHM